MNRAFAHIAIACAAAVVTGFLVLGAVVAARLFAGDAPFVIPPAAAGMLFSDILAAWQPLATVLLGVWAIASVLVAALSLARGRRLWPAIVIALVICTGIVHGLLSYTLSDALEQRDARYRVVADEEGRQSIEDQADPAALKTFARTHDRSEQLVKIEAILLLLSMIAAPLAAARSRQERLGEEETRP